MKPFLKTKTGIMKCPSKILKTRSDVFKAFHPTYKNNEKYTDEMKN